MNAAMTFAWANPKGWAAAMPGFLLLSVVSHAATFFLFQIVYSDRVTIAPPVPTVSLLDPRRPDHQALLRLIEAEDPAPVAAVQALVPRQLLDVPYRPSYATVRTFPQTLPEPEVAAQFPPPRDPFAIIRSAAPAPAESAPPLPPSATRVAFSGALADRAVVRTAPIAFQTRAATSLFPARFLIGVTDRGEVRFVFLQSSCGDLAADDEAAAHLARVSFSPGENPMTWGHAVFQWGDDVYAPGAPKAQ